jgi:L-seryl-tRNA(Ser) seleniumtransferase
MKVGKEEIAGMWKAVQIFVNEDHPKLVQEWWAKLNYVAKQIRKFDGVSTSDFVPPIDNHVPTMQIAWDPQKYLLTCNQAIHYLRSGNPAVLMWDGGPGASLTMADNNYIVMSSFMLQPGEERIVASRLKQMFQTHRA